MRYVLLMLLLAAGSAAAQPVQPPPARSYPVEDALRNAPIVTLRNSRITMRVAVPDLKRGFFRGTRFDQAGVVTSLVADGRAFYGPWFSRTAPEVLDYTYTDDGLVAGPDSAATGPVEEFAVIGFEEAKPGELFLKIGVGALRRPGNQTYDKYWHYEIADWGKRTMRRTRDSVTFTQVITDAPSGYSYVYEKTLRLVPGTARMEIAHVLRNTGTKPIRTTVYDHNFLRLTPGNDGITVRFPFRVAAEKPPAADLIRLDEKGFTYLRPQAYKERVSFLLTGFGSTPADYDIRIADRTGAGVTMTGDAPITRLNVFSLDTVQSVEPFIALDVPPGGEKRWRYTYAFDAGDAGRPR